MAKLNFSFIRRYLLALLVAILTYIFYSLIINISEEYHTLPLEVIFPDQYISSTPIVNSVNVTIKGSPANLARILGDDMKAVLDLSGYLREGIVTETVDLRKYRGFAQIENIEVSIDPATIEVSLEMRITRQVPVIPTFANSLPRGYLFDGFSVVPSNVEVVGPRSVVESLMEIPTDSVDLSTFTSAKSRMVSLKMPDFVRLESFESNEVRVFVNVNEVIIVRTFNNLDIRVNNLSETLLYTNTLANASLVVKGPQLKLGVLSPDVFVDMSSISTAGTYIVELQPNLPEDIEVISLEPKDTRIVLEDLTGQDVFETPVLEPVSIQEGEDTAPQFPPEPALEPFNENEILNPPVENMPLDAPSE